MITGIITINKLNIDLPFGTLVLLKKGTPIDCERYLVLNDPQLTFLTIMNHEVVNQYGGIITNRLDSLGILMWDGFQVSVPELSHRQVPQFRLTGERYIGERVLDYILNVGE